MGIFKRKPRPKARNEPDAPQRMEGLGRAADYFLNASEAMAAAGSRIANTVATAPLRLYKDKKVQPGHPLDKLVYYSPGPGLTPYTFKRDMELNRTTVGRAYAWICRGGDMVTPLFLRILDPARVQTLRVIETGDLWHQVATQDGVVMVPDVDMLCTSFLSNGQMARPIDILRSTMQYDAEIKDVSVSQLRGVNDTIVLETPGELGKEKRQSMIRDILEAYHSSGKQALLLDSGAKAMHLSGQAVDPKVLDVEKVTKTRVATVYGIPPHMLGAGENTRANSEEEMMEFLELAIIPPMAQWESELNKKLLTYKQVCDGYEFHFDRDALAQANVDNRTKMYHSAIRDGWMRPNEIRSRQYLPPDESGDELMMSRDMLPAWVNVKQPEMLLTGQWGKQNKE